MTGIADPRLDGNYDVVEMKRAMFTASTCIHHLPNMRPNMKRVQTLNLFYVEIPSTQGFPFRVLCRLSSCSKATMDWT